MSEDEDFDKYLGIANHDIQRANDYGQLKSYVASILYDYDKKVELLQQKEKIIKEVREYCLDKAKGRLERTLYDDILGILDKENKQ